MRIGLHHQTQLLGVKIQICPNLYRLLQNIQLIDLYWIDIRILELKGYERTDVLGQNELFISIHVFSARMLSDFYQSKLSSFLN